MNIVFPRPISAKEAAINGLHDIVRVESPTNRRLNPTLGQPSDAGVGSLRQAMLTANSTPGADEIRFQIGSQGSIQTIELATPLPAVADTVSIDGWTQGGSGYQGAPLIEIRGTGATSGFVLGLFNTNGCLIRGLAITGAPYPSNGIYVANGGGHTIAGNYVGLRPDGSSLGNGLHGIVFVNSSHNRLGGPGDEANVVASNSATGLILTGSLSSDNVIVGNRIGVDAQGAAARAPTLIGEWSSTTHRTTCSEAACRGMAMLFPVTLWTES